MIAFTPHDPTDMLDAAEPDALKAAEDRVAAATKRYDDLYQLDTPDDEMDAAYREYYYARRDLTTLREKLALEPK